MRWLLLLTALLCASCAPKPPEEMAEIEQERPTLVLEKASYRFSSDGIEPILLAASSISIDEKQHSARFVGASFTQEGENGIRGSSDQVTIDTESHNATLSGSVRIEQPSQGLAISSEQISWNNEEQVLSTPQDGVVEVTFDQTSTIKGSGFRGDLAHGLYEFAEITEGRVEQP